MLPYFLLVLVPFAMAFFSIQKSPTGKYTISIGRKSVMSGYNLMLPVFFIFLFILMVLRSRFMGNDTYNYSVIFDMHRTQSLGLILSDWREVLFKLLGWTIGRFTDDFQIYLAITSLIQLLPIAILVLKDRRHSFLQTIIFVNMSTFIMLFSGIRQSMAISVGLLAFMALQKEKKLRFIFWAVVATLLHTSGFLVFLLYPVYRMRVKRIHLFLVVPIMGFVLFFNQPIFLFLSRIVASTYDNYENITISSTGAYTSLILFVLFAVFCYIITEEKNMDKDTCGLRNIILFVVALQCFAPIHTLAMRVNYYFIIFVPIALGKCISSPKPNLKKLARYGELVMCGFFSVYYIYTVYMASLDPTRMLNIVPYIPFWETMG